MKELRIRKDARYRWLGWWVEEYDIDRWFCRAYTYTRWGAEHVAQRMIQPERIYKVYPNEERTA